MSVLRGGARDLAEVDYFMELARADTRRKLKRLRRKLKPVKVRLRRRDALEKLHDLRDEKQERRSRQADTPLLLPNTEESRAEIEAIHDAVTKHLERPSVRALVRELVAEKLSELAWNPTAAMRGPGAVLTPMRCDAIAAKLRGARRSGWYARHHDTRKLHYRYNDRSGQRLLDPDEARRDTARCLRRLSPAMERLVKLGLKSYAVTFTLPNVAPGRLADQKRLLFAKFAWDILGRDAHGKRRPGSPPFPEIKAAFAVQEDSFSARGDWHPHLHTVLFVDPLLCRRHGVALLPQPELPMPGHSIVKFPEQPRVVDRAPPGSLSFLKVRAAWGRRYQVEIQPIEGNADAIARSLREVVKYNVKWISAKSVARGVPGLRAAADTGGGARAPGAHARDDLAPLVLAAAPAAHADGCGVERRGLADFDGEGRGAEPVSARRVRAREAARAGPPLVEWPNDRLAELLIANHRFRRIRSYGLLYPLPPDQLPPDPEKLGKLRFLGRFWIDPGRAAAQAPRVDYVDLIHGDKSGRDFSTSSARDRGGGARDGPMAVGEGS